MGRWKKRFNWALYGSLRQVEREEAFRLLKWAVDSLEPPWDSGWKGVGRKPYDAGALTAVTIWREIEGKPERAYMADLENITLKVQGHEKSGGMGYRHRTGESKRLCSAPTFAS